MALSPRTEALKDCLCFIQQVKQSLKLPLKLISIGGAEDSGSLFIPNSRNWKRAEKQELESFHCIVLKEQFIN